MAKSNRLALLPVNDGQQGFSTRGTDMTRNACVHPRGCNNSERDFATDNSKTAGVTDTTCIHATDGWLRLGVGVAPDLRTKWGVRVAMSDIKNRTVALLFWEARSLG